MEEVTKCIVEITLLTTDLLAESVVHSKMMETAESLGLVIENKTTTENVKVVKR